jgi:hypothetical protein
MSLELRAIERRGRTRNDNRRSRFPSGMTTSKATAKAKEEADPYGMTTSGLG